jgi:hypothetical protein
MNSRIHVHRSLDAGRPRAPALSMMGLVLACLAAPLQAEDPLLGRIRVIKCVGCNPGEVKLVVHDPIDVRDFEVRIKESDFQKIISPLAGKTIYDKGGCFYWMEQPKGKANSAGTQPAKTSPDSSLPGTAGTGKPAGPESIDSSSSETGPAAGLAAEEPEGTPSRCIPFERIQYKPSDAEGKRGKPEE